MKYTLALLFVSASFLAAANSNLTEKHIKNQIEKEKKFSKEKTFYKGKYYDLKGAEVDEETVKNMKELPNYNEDFDMNDTYD